MGAAIQSFKTTTLKNQQVGPVGDLHQEYGRYGPFILTKSGSLIGAIRLGGSDPDGLLTDDFLNITRIGRVIYQSLGDNIDITQYCSHYGNEQIALKDRSDNRSHLLSKRRMQHLNKTSLTATNIVHYFEVKPSENLTKLNPGSLFKHLGMSITSKQSRDIIKGYFSAKESVVVYLRELERQKRQLESTLREVKDRWGSAGDASIMTLQDKWAHMRFLANLDPKLLSGSLKEKVPEDNWHAKLDEGDIEPVCVNGMDSLKLHRSVNKYVRIAAITSFGEDRVEPGMWSNSEHSPARLPYNFIIMTRFRPLTKLQRSLMFSRSNDELNRRTINIMDVVKGNEGENQDKDSIKPAIKRQMEELGNAEMIEDRWGLATSYVVTWDNDPEILRANCEAIKTSIERSMQMVWETADLGNAWRVFQPSGKLFSVRDIPFTTSQFAAASLLYKSHEGQVTVPTLKNEEAMYVFETPDGTPFHYSPHIGGKCVVIGIGPIRSGKSFTKNVIAQHFQKYKGLWRGIDIDAGSEPVALAFEDRGSVFKVDDSADYGFNLFETATGPDDKRFINHCRNQILMMIETNDSEELSKVTAADQKQIDHAIKATLELPKEMRGFSYVFNHCNESVKAKLSRWVKGQELGQYFDQEVDAMGDTNIPVAAFNLLAVKENDKVFPLVINEIFYRVTRAFENPDIRNIPKMLEMDECHFGLKIPYIRNYIIEKVLTWGKWFGGIALWTQSPRHLVDLPDWGAIRSAATTFFFMADQNMTDEDEALYKKAFRLTSGECEAIRKLTPKKEAYIVQRDIGVSKRVILNAEPEQYAVTTSTADEDFFLKNIQSMEFEEAVEKAVQQLVDLGRIQLD